MNDGYDMNADNRVRVGETCILLIIGFYVLLGGLGRVSADTTPAASGKETSAKSESQLRDPFLPVGYTPLRQETGTNAPVETAVVEPPPKQHQVTVSDREKALALLKIGGIIRKQDRFFATVNGMVVAVGDIIPVTVEGKVVKFVVRSIDLKRVRIMPLEDKDK